VHGPHRPLTQTPPFGQAFVATQLPDAASQQGVSPLHDPAVQVPQIRVVVSQTPVEQWSRATQLPVVGSQHGVPEPDGQGKAPPAAVQVPHIPLLQTPAEHWPVATHLPVFGSQHGVSPLQDVAVQAPPLHEPLRQVWPLPHFVPQAPQLFVSLVRSTQASPQQVRPAPQSPSR
jgi:hypothetical protein